VREQNVHDREDVYWSDKKLIVVVELFTTPLSRGCFALSVVVRSKQDESASKYALRVLRDTRPANHLKPAGYLIYHQV